MSELKESLSKNLMRNKEIYKQKGIVLREFRT